MGKGKVPGWKRKGGDGFEELARLKSVMKASIGDCGSSCVCVCLPSYRPVRNESEESRMEIKTRSQYNGGSDMNS